jgi:hypothetical protein
MTGQMGGFPFNAKRWGIHVLRFPPFAIPKRGYMRHRVRELVVRNVDRQYGRLGEYTAHYACGARSNNVWLTDDPTFMCASAICGSCEGRVKQWREAGYPCGPEIVEATA